MKLRALQDTIFIGPKGPVYITGNAFNDKEELIGIGQEIEVPDDFVVNPQVWTLLEPPASGKVQVYFRGEPGQKGKVAEATWTPGGEPKVAPKPEPKKVAATAN